MHRIAFIFLLCIAPFAWSQSNFEDSKYLEDQFYLGITYNFLLDKPEGASQRSFSYGLQGGFIKDIPLNTERNVGFGIGLGYAVNSYYTNIQAEEVDNEIEYRVLLSEDNVDFKRNKIETHLIEAPIEFRWRTSNATDYKFWRIYTGIKFGYVIGARSKFISDSTKLSFSNSDVRQFNYGLTFNFGYNTFNFQAYYALNTLFDEKVNLIDGQSLDVKPLRIGIIFYIL
ncbi:hypothetical protein GGR42_001462 [Saonia flava]|uniref:Outer membrane protein beta-barrel domain-containing protein n=1 Tax=Saonia flava TaxID=523696 RepID=A0A846QVQ2_9FLAO|nr:porin family protein [Saonia flava]NJB71000.1 hypothetical protein [Saonia flava]